MEISKTKASQLASLQSRKMRDRLGLFLAEGSKCVADTLGAFELDCIVAIPEWLERNAALTEGARVFTATRPVLERISSLQTAPEVVAAFRIPGPDDGQPVLDAGLHLLLDGIRDPGNLGTIIRTADWFGFDRVYASPDTVSVFNPKTVQATMGSLRRVRVVYTPLPQLLERSGVANVFGTLLEGEDIFRADLPQHGVIVMGNEGQGLSQEMRRMVTRPLNIPPWKASGHAESLNVAVAAAIVMAQFRGMSEAAISHKP